MSQITHERSRSWKEGQDGELLNIYIDTIPTDQYEARQAEIERLGDQLARTMEG